MQPLEVDAATRAIGRSKPWLLISATRASISPRAFVCSPRVSSARHPFAPVARIEREDIYQRDADLRSAACRIRSVISCGCEMSDKWLACTSIVVAPMRLAMYRSRSGLIVRSSVETA
jgi:hypothetical protein